MAQWNKMMMECILAKDDKEFQEKKEKYINEVMKNDTMVHR